MKKTITIALVTAMLVTLVSVFATAATTIAITVTPPTAGETVSSVGIKVNGSSHMAIGCFDYDTYHSTFEEFKNNKNFDSEKDSYLGVDGKDISNTSCIANKKYIAVFFTMDDENPFPSGTALNVVGSDEYGIIYNGGTDLYGYVVFTPNGSNIDSDQSTTEPDNTPTGNTSPENTPSDTSGNNTTSANTSSSHDVTVTYQKADEPTTVYKVDITWGSLAFTYTEESKGTWNTSTHQYENPEESSWSCAQGANAITVKNHSNAAVNVSFSYEAKNDFSSVTGSFSNNTISLATAEGKSPSDAPSGAVNLYLDGTINEPFTGESTCGTVTVTIN